MKKILYILLITITVFTFSNVSALNKEITSLTVKEESGKINVAGTTESGCSAVAIMVYKEDGTTLVTMKTTGVNDDNTFTDSIDIKNGNYVVKVADYDGGEFSTETVTIKTNPNTGDNIYTYVIVLGISLVLATCGIVYFVKKKN